MNDLRLIILIIGLVFIAGIYIRETIRQRNLQRRQTVQYTPPENELPHIRVSTARENEDDVADAISDLNEFLAGSKRYEDQIVAEGVSVQLGKTGDRNSGDNGTIPAAREGDLFDSTRKNNTGSSGPAPASTEFDNIDANRIIRLHITRPGGKAFNGGEILAAVNTVGMEYGEMNIFHHYGIGPTKMDRPLFSLADMYEPGSFDMENIDTHNTRGVVLFLCLPVPVDGRVVFELMLNIAQTLAVELDGELCGPDQELINEDQITAMRNKFDLFKY